MQKENNMELSTSERQALLRVAAIWDAKIEDTGSKLTKEERERCLKMLGFYATRYEE